MDACSLRQDQQRGRARWWRSRLCSETGGSEQGHYILRHTAVGGLTGARHVANAVKRKSHVKPGAMTMRRIAPVIALVAALIVPAFAQKAEIEAVNAKWIDIFSTRVISPASRRSTRETRPRSHRVQAWLPKDYNRPALD